MAEFAISTSLHVKNYSTSLWAFISYICILFFKAQAQVSNLFCAFFWKKNVSLFFFDEKQNGKLEILLSWTKTKKAKSCTWVIPLPVTKKCLEMVKRSFFSSVLLYSIVCSFKSLCFFPSCCNFAYMQYLSKKMFPP